MKTGKDVIRRGRYYSECCFIEADFEERQMLPRCPKCLELTIWVEAEPAHAGRDQKAA